MCGKFKKKKIYDIGDIRKPKQWSVTRPEIFKRTGSKDVTKNDTF